MNMKNFLYTISIVLIIFSFTGCLNQHDNNPIFSSNKEKLQETDVPVDFSYEDSDWLIWNRDEDWLRVGYLPDKSAQIFANNKETDKLYLLFNDNFYVLNWKSVRQNEEDIELFTLDIDDDTKDELIVISSVKGGTNWHREKLYIIKTNEQYLTSIEFPLSKFENWIKENLLLEESQISFFDFTLDLSDNTDFDNNSESVITSVSFLFNEDFEVNVEVSTVSEFLIPTAEIHFELTADNESFFIRPISMQSPD